MADPLIEAYSGDDGESYIAPQRQYIITLSGEAEIGLSDGTIHRLEPGDVHMVEDLTGGGPGAVGGACLGVR